MTLVLSLFPGIGMLDHAFELEGFTVVRGPDPLWGGDVRRFRLPAGRFDGVIGGDPCQSHSALANLVRAKGLEPSFPDLTPEYQRVIEEARPTWFLRENVPQAPDVKPAGYDVRAFMLDNSTLDSGDGWGNEQMRKRRFWFGVRDGEAPELRQWMRSCALLSINRTQAVSASDPRPVPVALVKGGKTKSTYSKEQVKRSIPEMLRLQGFPDDWIGHQPWTMQAMRKMVGNGVPLPMGRELARAIRIWMETGT